MSLNEEWEHSAGKHPGPQSFRAAGVLLVSLSRLSVDVVPGMDAQLHFWVQFLKLAWKCLD